MSSYFYLQAEKNTLNADFLEKLEEYADSNKQLIYALDRPLTDQKYFYKYKQAVIVLSPKNKIAVIDFGNKPQDFEDFIEDVLEDIGSISDKYLYKDVVGRPRKWRNTLLDSNFILDQTADLDIFFEKVRLTDEGDKKKLDLLISLFIGSINDIERVKEDVPITTLDKVKQKIQLFDGDQTRFIYQKLDKKKIRIQGLSGTGKTELLLHKLKDLYTGDSGCSIFFTCHNKILADNLKKRIPSFFNFMKVEQQIEWEKRLWCTNAWGSAYASNSGAYRYICAFYKISFRRYSYQMSFSMACKLAIDEIKAKYADGTIPPAFTYMFIDESQDFDDNFFTLCEMVTQENVYIAGDIFQSIFDEEISQTIEPDFLLGKCYRTDPRTLMFAHGLGMGLFEEIKLRWLEEKEWRDCGYNVSVKDSKYYLSREPLRRFEDIEENFESIKITEINKDFESGVIEIIKQIRRDNATVLPDDIGIVLLDQENYIYALADSLEFQIQKNINWPVNKAYETKEKIPGTVLLSNRNNVKGLEFPFIICITKKIRSSASYRNSIYTMLTRSFITSYFLIPSDDRSGLTEGMKAGLKDIITKKKMIIEEPTEKEKKKIRTRFEYNLKKLSHFDLVMEVFKTHHIEEAYHDKLLAATQQMEMFDADFEILTEFILSNLKYLKEK